ncbi:MAG: DUF4357 domain-containing protein [Succinivibrionaceae bacterium]|nr:DUF4357 domain-containing protein [Succinivibrionaceae bacterium]
MQGQQGEVRFLVDAQGRRTHAVLPIAMWERLLALSEMMRDPVPLGEHEIYTLRAKNVTARGYPEGMRIRPGFVILQGSEAALLSAESLPGPVREFRERLYEDGVLILDAERSAFVLQKDLRVKSPSFAAQLIAGNARNGLSSWINRGGFSLRESGWGPRRDRR